MTNIPLKRESLLPRIDGIARDKEKLQNLGALTLEEFSLSDNFDRVQFYLRRALEGVFHIGAHILSRKNGGRVTQYQDIARHLGEFGIIDKQFSEGPLMRMAKYRNRLTHFYSDIAPEELYRIINDNLPDIDIFLHAIRQLVEEPEKFAFTIE
ncbi:MAG: DUF86 domain-containing protein [Candidatus Portnoybacteria bacterium]|nr:DUF86 domain-containing protein [Candidatus Portnoybacteria bacterium]